MALAILPLVANAQAQPGSSEVQLGNPLLRLSWERGWRRALEGQAAQHGPFQSWGKKDSGEVFRGAPERKTKQDT